MAVTAIVNIDMKTLATTYDITKISTEGTIGSSTFFYIYGQLVSTKYEMKVVQEAMVSLPKNTKNPPMLDEIANLAMFFRIKQKPLMALVQKFSEVKAT